MKTFNFLTYLMLGTSTLLFAQQKSQNPLKISGYAEIYYQYDFSNPENNTRPSFVYSHNRNNEVNLNLGFVKANYETETFRGNLALAAGTYMNANYAAEPGVLKNVYEANVGVKISNNKNFWIDAGIMPSHIGFESAIGMDCWNLTRSILADNSPYYESGAKISYSTDDGKWFVSGLILNGWQRIQKVDGNSTPSFGHQLTYKPNSKITLNSSSFIGNDKPDSTKQIRYFHNLYGIFQLNKKMALVVEFDIGVEQKAKGYKGYNFWYSPVAIVRYIPVDKLAFAIRTEYYSDKNGVMIYSNSPNGFQTVGFSANMDVQITDNVLWRIESRILKSMKDKIFIESNHNPTTNNIFVATSLSLKF